MSNVDLFKFEGQEIRTVVIDGEPWFVAVDVATVLGYSEPGRAVRQHCKGGANHTPLETAGGTQNVRIIAEPDVMRMIVSSKLPAAEQFERWVFEDVLPTIRKTGRYGSDASMLAELPSSHLLQLAAETARRAEEAEAKIAADASKVIFADAVAASEDTILIGRLATILRQNGDDVGEIRLFRRLREDGYLCRTGADRNRPTQRAMDLGLFETIERTVQGSDGTPRLKFTPKVTGKGQQYFIEKYAPKDHLALEATP
ncbi:phage antirepressor [Leucobacter sp.]